MSRETRNHVLVCCDRCGKEVAVVNPDESRLGFPTAEIAQAEVWLSPPGNRGGIRYTENDEVCEKRVQIYDSCNECAATAMSLVEAFYEKRDHIQPPATTQVGTQEKEEK